MDPFSVSSGVAGLISLGITVCKGLNIYCQDYRSRDVDILLLGQHAERLEAFLQLIKSRTDGAVVVDHSLSNSFRECFTACDVCLQDFKTLSAKYSQPSATQGLREKGKTVMRQLQYPFQKGRFDSLRSQMEDFRSAFLSLLLLMNHDLAKELQENAKAEAAQLAMTICAQTQKTQNQIAAIMPDMEVVVERSLAKLDHSLQERLYNLETAISLSLQSRKLSLPPSQPADDMGCYRLPQEPGSIHQEPGEHASIFEGSRNKHRLPADPRSLLRDLQEKEFLTMTALPNEPSGSPTPPSLLCSCWVSLWQTRSRILTNRRPRHDKQCALFFLNKNTRAFGGNVKMLGLLFKWKMTLQYSSFIMRDLKIQPNLTVRAVVASNSGAHGAINRLVGHKYHSKKISRKDLHRILSQGMREIHGIFKSGTARPTDVDQNGYNLVHILLTFFEDYWDIGTTAVFTAFLKDLVFLGVPLNDVAEIGTPLRYFIYGRAIRKRFLDTLTHIQMKPGELALVKEMMLMDARFGERPADPILESYPLILSDIYESCSDSINSFEYGALFQALIQKSETDVRRLLLSSTDLMFERGHDNQTPLHVAVCWPKGLSLLFELVELACDSIIDAQDSNDQSAIDSAIFLQQVESVRILLDHNAAVNFENSGNFGHPWAAHRPESRDLYKLLSNELGCRRRRLLSIALEHLPDTSISKLGLRSMSIIQNNATEVINQLKRQHVIIPQIYHRAQLGSVYHAPVLPASLAESLFQAGFTEVDFLVEGYSPLMIIRLPFFFTINLDTRMLHDLLSLIDFFEEEGADIHRPIPHSSHNSCPRKPHQFRVVHRLAYLLGDCVYTYLLLKDLPAPLRQSDQHSLRRVLAARSRDPCLCYCTFEGCSPASNYAKACLFHKLDFLSILPRMFALFPEGVAGQCRNQYVYDMIRVCTFVKLGMRHTCCSYREFENKVPNGKFDGLQRCGLRVMEIAEVAEIQEEDRHTAELLEMLMADFEARLQSHPEPLDHFVSDYWWRRMSQVEAEREQVGDDDIQAMRDVGVHFECESAASEEA